MIRNILHQLWNSRRQNGWIFLELIIVSYFLWLVIDPVYVLTANRMIPKGYDSKGVYALLIYEHEKNYVGYDTTSAAPEVRKNLYRQILRTVRQCPEIASYAIATWGSFPYSHTFNGNQFTVDTTNVPMQTYFYDATDGSSLPAVFRLQDVNTGQMLKTDPDCVAKHHFYISELLAKKAYGTTQVVGKKYDMGMGWVGTIAGVFADFKQKDTEQPFPLAIFPGADEMNPDALPWSYPIIFRLKDGVDARKFEARFKRDIVPKLSVGNFYFRSLRTLDELAKVNAESTGVNNKLRLQYALAGFALLCIFLGMMGTFWIRCEARSMEIGLLRSFGATRKSICRRFLTEAWILVTAAFLITLPFVVHHVHEAGFALPSEHPNPEYLQNQLVPHFLIVSVVTYIALLVIALVGTYIPASRAARSLPAEALRDE